MVKPENITKASGRVIDYLHPHESQASSWPGAAVETTHTNMAFCGIAEHSGPLRKSNPKVNVVYFGPQSLLIALGSCGLAAGRGSQSVSV